MLNNSEVSGQNRLPVDHPHYRYSTSKNPYWTKLQGFQNLVYSDNQTELHSGNWNSQFAASSQTSKRELHVEIGCNAGHVILEWATQQPHKNFIGIDWKFKPIFRGAEKSNRKELKNLLFFRAHAERISYMFGPNEVDHLSLFFPDPWQKKAQTKNRFITEKRLREIFKIMKPQGIFHIKTDHPGYFEWMLEAVGKTSDIWKTVEFSRDLHKDHPNPTQLRIPEVTLFESLFIKDQIPIQSIKLQAIKG